MWSPRPLLKSVESFTPTDIDGVNSLSNGTREDVAWAINDSNWLLKLLDGFRESLFSWNILPLEVPTFLGILYSGISGTHPQCHTIKKWLKNIYFQFNIFTIEAEDWTQRLWSFRSRRLYQLFPNIDNTDPNSYTHTYEYRNQWLSLVGICMLFELCTEVITSDIDYKEHWKSIMSDIWDYVTCPNIDFWK